MGIAAQVEGEPGHTDAWQCRHPWYGVQFADFELCGPGLGAALKEELVQLRCLFMAGGRDRGAEEIDEFGRILDGHTVHADVLDGTGAGGGIAGSCTHRRRNGGTAGNRIAGSSMPAIANPLTDVGGKPLPIRIAAIGDCMGNIGANEFGGHIGTSNCGTR